MEQLIIQSPGGKDVTTSLKIAEVFGKRHDDVLRAIRNIECTREFGVRNFAETPYTHPQNGQEYYMYYITKDGFSFLAMGFTGERAAQFKEMFINEFNKREALLKNDDYILMRSQEILKKRIEDVEHRLSEANAKIAADAPKVLLAEALTQSKDTYLIKELAAYLSQNGYEIGQNNLYKQLRFNGFLCIKGSYYNLPSQKSIELDLFRIKKTVIHTPDGEIKTSNTVYVTGKGMSYFLTYFLKQSQRA